MTLTHNIVYIRKGDCANWKKTQPVLRCNMSVLQILCGSISICSKIYTKIQLTVLYSNGIVFNTSVQLVLICISLRIRKTYIFLKCSGYFMRVMASIVDKWFFRVTDGRE